jgi:ElaB/YqjD/DUF883 family membrane-anchored ribosome-binding protein
MPVSPDIPTALLEQRAIEQRRRLHNSVSELREQVEETVREKLDLRSYAAEYAWQAAGVAALLGLLFGSSTARVLKNVS